MRLAAALIALLIAAPLALAAPAEDVCEYLANSSLEGAQLPGYVPYGNERINLYTGDDTSVGHVITESSVVTSANCTAIDAPTYEVYVQDLATVDRILHADAPMSQLNDERRARNVEIRASTFSKQVKNSVLMGVTRVLSWLGL